MILAREIGMNLKEGTGAGLESLTVNRVSFAQDTAPLSLTPKNKLQGADNTKEHNQNVGFSYAMAVVQRARQYVSLPHRKGKSELSLLLWAD